DGGPRREHGLDEDGFGKTFGRWVAAVRQGAECSRSGPARETFSLYTARRGRVDPNRGRRGAARRGPARVPSPGSRLGVGQPLPPFRKGLPDPALLGPRKSGADRPPRGAGASAPGSADGGSTGDEGPARSRLRRHDPEARL